MVDFSKILYSFYRKAADYIGAVNSTAAEK